MLSQSLAVAAAVSALMPLGSAFDAHSKSNVAIYYVWMTMPVLLSEFSRRS